MAKKLALIHTASMLAPKFTALVKETIPDLEVFNIVDESLLNNTIAANQLTPDTSRRLAEYVASAEQAGADVILVTCSSIGPAVEAARPFVNVPVLRVDQPMAEQAVQMGARIGVIATLPTTLAPTTELVRACAAAAGKQVEIVTHLCDGAFAAVVAGNSEEHDRLVAAGLTALMANVDVIVLAQASMARVVDQLPESSRTVPILSSPQLGIEQVKNVL